MATPIKGIPTNQTWAGNSPNKLEISDADKGKGIIFQSNIVSNQLNTAFNTLSENQRYMQCSGGFYLENMRYFKGHIVAINVITNPTFGLGIRYFQCINDNNGAGIVNINPYKNVTNKTNNNGLTTYTANTINSAYWAECSGVTSELQKFTEDAVSDKWKDLGSVSGSFSMNFGGDNDKFNNFTLSLTANTKFTTVASVSSCKERSGLLVIKSGGDKLTNFFSAGVAYYSFEMPFPTPPVNGLSMLVFPYKLIPSLNKVIFSRA